MRRGWLILLVLYLAFFVPMNFAVELATTLPTVRFRGAIAMIELAAHGAAATFALAAGWALWSGNPDALRLAAYAVALSAAVAIQSIYWTALPSQTAPGQHLPYALLNAAHGLAWLWYLRRRARASR